MFTSKSQNSNRIKNSSMYNKRQKFHNQIRRKKIQQYQAKIRQKLLYKNQQTYDLLHEINLNQNLKILAKYEFPNLPNNKFNNLNQIQIDNPNKNYDLQSPQNFHFRKIIQQIFVYATSERKQHLNLLIDDIHLTNLIDLLKKKVDQVQYVYNKQKDLEGNNEEIVGFPRIYEQILVILTEFCSYTTIFQNVIEFYQLVNRLLVVFRHQIRILSFCIPAVAFMLYNQNVLERIRQDLSNHPNQSTVSKIQYIFQRSFTQLNCQAYHSTIIFYRLFYFYQRLFQTIKITNIDPQLRKRIFQTFQHFLNHNSVDQELLLQASSCLFCLYDNNISEYSSLILQTQKIISCVVDRIFKIISRKKQATKMPSLTKELCKTMFIILIKIFQYGGNSEESFQQIVQFLDSEYDQGIELIIQQGLKSHQDFIINYSLNLAKVICLWGDLVVKVYQNGNIMRGILYESRNQNFKLRKQAICSLCNIIQGLFSDRKSFEQQLQQIYQNLIQRNNITQILVNCLDTYHDLQLNLQILKIIYILAQFWENDPQLEKINRFWMRFIEFGGQLKLNSYLNQDKQRDESLKQKVVQLLDRFASKQVVI